MRVPALIQVILLKGSPGEGLKMLKHIFTYFLNGVLTAVGKLLKAVQGLVQAFKLCLNTSKRFKHA